MKARSVAFNLKIRLLLAFFMLVLSHTFAYALSDPTRPAYYTLGNSSYIENLKKGYRLSSVLVSNQRKIAIINGERLGEGDRIGEAQVKRIDKQGVSLKVQGTELRIELVTNKIKRIK